MGVSRGVAVWLVGVLAALVTTAPASASWLSPIVLPAPVGDAGAAGVAATPQGTIAVLSARNVTASPTQYALDVYVRPPGGSFGNPQPLEPLSTTTLPQPSGLAAAPDGSIQTGWRAGTSFKFARLEPGATTFTTLPSYTFAPGEFPGFFLSAPLRQPDGTLVAIAVTNVPTGGTAFYYVKAFSLAPGAGSWTVATLDTIPYSSSSPLVTAAQPAIDTAGHVAVAWTVYNPGAGTPYYVKVARTTTGAAFAPPETLDSSMTESMFYPSLATSPAGETTVMWVHGGSSPSIRTKSTANGSAFPAGGGTPVSTPVASTPNQTRLASAGDDLLSTLVFTASGGPYIAQIGVNLRPAGQAFGAFAGVSQSGVPNGMPDLVGRTDGTGIATWLRGNGNGYIPRVQAVIRRPGFGWGQRENVTGPIDTSGSFAFSGPLAAFDESGNPLVAFAQGDGDDPQHSRSALAVDDLTPPAITDFNVPGSGVAGSPLHVTAGASDDWSGVTFSWDFGDGTTATGAAADHAFAAAGTPTVTVTATDGGGNTATRSAQVTVANPPVPAPVISSLKVSPRRFKLRKGTTISFGLSERADVTLTFARKRPKHRYAKAGSLKRAGKGPGTVKMKFKGHVGKKTLKPGTYRLTVTARDAAGHTAKPARTTFTVLRAKS
jgi:hypothetical protein